MGGISFSGESEGGRCAVAGTGVAGAGGPGDLCLELFFGPRDLYLTLSFLDFKKLQVNRGCKDRDPTPTEQTALSLPWVLS